MFARMVWRRFASYGGWSLALCLAFVLPTPANELATDQQKLVAAGAKLFAHQWQANDPISRGGDGLGPVYNETSCAACHCLGGTGGGGPAANNVQLIAVSNIAARRSVQSLGPSSAAIDSRFRTIATPVLHRFGTSKEYARWRENRLLSSPNVLEMPSMQETDAAKQRAAIATSADVDNQRSRNARPGSLTERNAAALFGDGLIDEIPDAVIQAQVNTPQRFGPLETATKMPQTSPIQGRVVLVADGRVGKFGSKAQQATLGEFTLFACAVELGLEVPNNHQSADPTDRGKKVNDLDMDQNDCDALTAFVRSIPAPRRETPEDATRETVMIGEVLFDRIGCAACHKPRLGDIDGLYSDLLVHDMGQELSDPTVYYGQAVTVGATTSLATPARAAEWRTPPLWGVADSAPYLHDGRARTLKEAILLHDGQASDSANHFSGLGDNEQSAVLCFLRSLKAPQAPADGEQLTVN